VGDGPGAALTGAMAIPHFDLHPGVDETAFVSSPPGLVLTPGNTVQGGAGLGAAITAMERVTGRPAIWATAQYLSFAYGSDPIDVDVTVEVAGHNTTQARCVLRRDGREIMTTHAALGSREFEWEGVWAARPDVPDPQHSEHFRFFERGSGDIGDLAEFRLALGRQLDDVAQQGTRGNGDFALWVRCWEGSQPIDAAALALIGDFMPLGFADAIGAGVSGNSLDNTIRLGDLTDTEWILMSVHVQQIANGFGYGRAELWAEDGTLLGEVSQSAIMRDYSRFRDTMRPDARSTR
jgi:acyl-CoA thioesterase